MSDWYELLCLWMWMQQPWKGQFTVIAKFPVLRVGMHQGSGQDGDADAAVTTRIRSGWFKFRSLASLLAAKDVSLLLWGKVHDACVRSWLLHGSEMESPRSDNHLALHRAGMGMIRWMCGVKQTILHRIRGVVRNRRRRITIQTLTIQIMYYTDCNHHPLQHHSTTTSGAARTHSSYLSTPPDLSDSNFFVRMLYRDCY